MELVYFSVGSSSRRGVEKSLFQLTLSFTLQENRKIWCKIHVIMYSLKEHWSSTKFYKGVYSAKDFFSPGCKIFYFFPLLVFSSKEGNKIKKIFSKLFILFVLSPLPHILLAYFHQKGEKNDKKMLPVLFIFTPLKLHWEWKLSRSSGKRDRYIHIDGHDMHPVTFV